MEGVDASYGDESMQSSWRMRRCTQMYDGCCICVTRLRSNLAITTLVLITAQAARVRMEEAAAAAKRSEDEACIDPPPYDGIEPFHMMLRPLSI